MPSDEELARAARAAARLGKIAELALADQADLSLPQYRLMAMLSDGSQAATALADHLTVTRPSITALADGLVERGFIDRHPDPGDRRRITHSLTDGGRAALDTGDQAIQQSLTDVLGHIPDPEEAETALRGLSIWITALDAARVRRATPG
jgi:long-chain acyl-CoA synthetase